MRPITLLESRFASQPANLDSSLSVNLSQPDEYVLKARSKRDAPINFATLEGQKHASDLVKEEDFLLSQSFTGALADRAIALLSAPNNPPAKTVENIPPYSSFGQMLSRFTEELKKEPFASYVQKKNINTAHFKLFPSEGRLECVSNGVPITLTNRDPNWRAVSATLCAIARELMPTLPGPFEFSGANRAPLEVIGDFYATPVSTDLVGTLRTLDKLGKIQVFPSLVEDSQAELNADQQARLRVRQVQKDVIDTVATTLSGEPMALPASNRDLSVEQSLEINDRSLAYACAPTSYLFGGEDLESLIKIRPDTTFGVAWFAYKKSLDSEAFLNFAETHGIDVETILIDPQSGTLSATANGSEIRFTREDSAWAAVAGPIMREVKNLAAGSAEQIPYPDAFVDASLVLNFYAEPTSHDTLLDSLKYWSKLQHHGFSALRKDPTPTDERSRAVQARRQAAIQALSPPTQTEIQEKKLVQAYTTRLREAVETEDPVWVRVPDETALGKWLELYRSLFDHPAVQEWMNAKKLFLAELELNPSNGTLTAKGGRDVKVFSLNDASGWKDIAGPLINVARVITPSADQSMQIAPANHFIQTPLGVVADFHGETSHPDDTAQLQRADQLDHQQAFDPIAPDDTLRPANARSPAALERLKLDAQKYFNALSTSRADKQDFTRLLLDVYRALPDVRHEAKTWAEALILKLTGKVVDADTIYVNRFIGSQGAHTQTGWEHLDEEPVSSLRLPDALLQNFSEHDRVPGNLDLQAGLYTDGPGKSKTGGYGAHNEFPLPPSKVMHEASSTDFQQHMTDKLEHFWKEHADEYRDSLKGEFVYQAREQLKAYETLTPSERARLPAEQQFTRSDYERVMKAASNVAVDPQQPIPFEALQARAPVKHQVRTHAFDINGLASTDIIRFTDLDDGQYLYLNGRRDGWQTLYIPGHSPAFLSFDSFDAMDRWIVDQARDPLKKQALASHFSLHDRQDDPDGTLDSITHVVFPISQLIPRRRPEKGVDTALSELATGYMDNLEGTVIDHGNFPIRTDVFDTIMQATSRRMSSDADVTIKSNSEVTRDTWLNDLSVAAGLLAKMAPIAEPVAALAIIAGIAEGTLGAQKEISGDTEAERRDGSAKALDGMLNALFSIDAAERPEDPFSASTQATARPLAGAGAKPAISGAPTNAVADRTLPLSQEQFADGEKALVIDRPLSPDSYSIARSSGFDLVDGENVYRFDTDRPELLSNLESTERLDKLDQFENICPAPVSLSGRSRRGLNDMCFVKALEPVTTEAGKELQSLEHVRLFPAPRKSLFNSDREVIFEKRLNRVVDTELGNKLVPLPDRPPIKYRSLVEGSISKNARFGMYDASESDFLRDQSYVVKLGKISDICKDSREVRGIVVSSSNPVNTRKYLVIEADTAEFYKALITEGQTGKVNFVHCEPSEFDLDLVKQYRQQLTVRQGAAAVPFDADLVALPPLDKALASLKNTGYTPAQIQDLKSSIADMTAEQKREVVYQLQSRNAIEKPDIALKPARVRPLAKPSNFANLTVEQQNEFLAKNAEAAVTRGLRATGLGPGNQVRSASDEARAQAAGVTVEWIRRTTNPHALDRGNLILKAGAGNCGEMSQLSKSIVAQSGGRAYEWSAGDAHAFTLVGGPTERPPATLDFSEPEYRGAWIVDPWAGIACPANEYIEQLQKVMENWQASGLKIAASPSRFISPTDPEWLNSLVRQPKQAYGHSYP
ncbi:hypothetical protein C4J95_3087 [Pseudomonas orientalis]|uniref:dermonecrotic toxin domain-containing protein n=1 Tax=Pseudomonas orientalis TaxID=76758 RepID=UPI000F573DA8|nr:DUF6543 domain-containing protein [Pseudomonas orientalis]AZF00548.1 hypothetical protein C4J95_3087 [Pseudomonas orientalis]